MPMKKVLAIIKPFKLEDVQTALRNVGVQGMTVTEVKGFGRQRGHAETYRGAEYEVQFIPKLEVEIVVDDDSAAALVDALMEAASTGTLGDGKIFVSDIEEAIRIRTGERGVEAI
jgi:nitrogen regulatory protein P-II 1